MAPSAAWTSLSEPPLEIETERMGLLKLRKLRAFERGRGGEGGCNFLVFERDKEKGTEKWREAAMAALATRSEHGEVFVLVGIALIGRGKC
jgi:hypothetical protein